VIGAEYRKPTEMRKCMHRRGSQRERERESAESKMSLKSVFRYAIKEG
jgi:hypothetical protein